MGEQYDGMVKLEQQLDFTGWFNALV